MFLDNSCYIRTVNLNDASICCKSTLQVYNTYDAINTRLSTTRNDMAGQQCTRRKQRVVEIQQRDGRRLVQAAVYVVARKVHLMEQNCLVPRVCE